MTRRLVELVGGPGCGVRATDHGETVIHYDAHARYVWDGQPATLHPDDTAVRRFILAKPEETP